MTDDPREELTRRVLHGTAVELLSPAPETFDRLRAAGRRRRTQRRYAAMSGVAAVTAAVVALVLVVGPGRGPESTLQPGGAFGNFLSQSTHGRLSVGATIPLDLSTRTAITAAEAPDGAFFYAPQSQVDSMGHVKPGTSGTNIVRVVDGSRAPAIAEHAPGRVVGLAADSIDLYVATPTQVIRYARNTGDEIRAWPLLRSPVNDAHLVLAGRWMYISTGFQCDFCGIETNTLLSVNLVTGERRVLTTETWPMGIAGNEKYVYYNRTDGAIVRVGPTGRGETSAPTNGPSPIVGLFAAGLEVQTGPNTMTLFDPARLTPLSHRRVPSVAAINMVPGVSGGAFYSDAACEPGVSATICRGDLGSSVSRVNVATGHTSDLVGIPGAMFLLGPAPAAVTANGSSYDLVRIR